jgi:hypothetical protein
VRTEILAAVRGPTVAGMAQVNKQATIGEPAQPRTTLHGLMQKACVFGQRAGGIAG